MNRAYQRAAPLFYQEKAGVWPTFLCKKNNLKEGMAAVTLNKGALEAEECIPPKHCSLMRLSSKVGEGFKKKKKKR